MKLVAHGRSASLALLADTVDWRWSSPCFMVAIGCTRRRGRHAVIPWGCVIAWEGVRYPMGKKTSTQSGRRCALCTSLGGPGRRNG